MDLYGSCCSSFCNLQRENNSFKTSLIPVIDFLQRNQSQSQDTKQAARMWVGDTFRENRHRVLQELKSEWNT